MAEVLNHVLARQIARNEDLPRAVLDVVDLLLTSRAIEQCERDEGTSGPVMKRWNMRVASLVAAKLPSTVRAAGWQLVATTFIASETSMLAQTKTLLPLALSTTAHDSVDPVLFARVVDVLTFVAASSLRHNEWAKEHVTPQTVQKMVQNMTARASASPELLAASVEGILRLIPLFSTALRPLYQSLHDLSASLLAADSQVSQYGARLFVKLYLLAPKGREGLQDAWRKATESLVGAVHSMLPSVTDDIFIEGAQAPAGLAPLALASPQAGEQHALRRIETLVDCLCRVLSTPTSEKAGNVPIPVGDIVELGNRLVLLNADAPVRERQDPAQVTLVRTLLPRLQLAGCQLLAQLAVAIGPRLLGSDKAVLIALSSTLSTYSIKSPMRASVAKAYAIVLESLGAGVDTNEAQRSLPRVWRVVLEDIGAVALEEQASAPESTDLKADNSGSRKKKRQRMYDPSEDLNKRGVRVSDEVLDNAENALDTLARLQRCPVSRFIAPQLKLAAARLVLSLAIEPDFFSSTSRTSASMTYLAGAPQSTLESARQSTLFRRRIVECLRAICEANPHLPGLIEKAVYIWRRAALDGDEEISSLAKAALRETMSLIHPAVPPMQKTSVLARQEQDQAGGDLGHETEFAELLQEFAPVQQAEQDHQEQDHEMQVDASLPTANGATTPAAVSLLPASTTTRTNGFAKDAFSFSGFATAKRSAPVQGDIPGEPAEQPEAAEDEVESTAVNQMTFMDVERSVPTKASTKRYAETTAVADKEDGESSDDETMPEIHFSDDE